MQQTDPRIEDQKMEDVFRAVARERRVTLRKLGEELGLDKDELHDKLSALKKAELVEEKPSSIEDLNIYYLTRYGFSAERRLKRQGMKLKGFA